MPRSIPAQLLLHKSGSATTLCYLIKIVSRNGEHVVGMTNLDRSLTYDDGRGTGPVLYHAPVGFDPANIYTASNTDVGNTEFESLVPVYDFDLNQVAVNAGEFDYADYWVMEVNYADLSMGHWVVMHGKLGEIRTTNGSVIWGELRSVMDQLKKPVVQLYSVGCRSVFGSTSATERYPCGFPVETLWKAATVVGVGAESTRTFEIDLSDAEGMYVPGMWRFTTGQNAGREVEVESFTPTGSGVAQVSLAFPAPYPIEDGDEGEIRRDCSKIARDEHKGCKFWYGADWIHRFNGEPDIPLGDNGALSVPGAAVNIPLPGHVSHLTEDQNE